MLQILSVTFPFFALIALGFAAAKTKILPMLSIPGMNLFVLYFALTAMLFQLGATTPVAQLLDPAVMGLWLVAGLAVMSVAVVTSRHGGKSWLDAAFGALIAVLPNSGFMGVPLLIALVGNRAAGPISASLIVDIVLIQSIGLAVSHIGAGNGSAWSEVAASLRRAVKNPLPWSIVLGAVVGVTGLPVPGPLDRMLTILAAAATPVALFTIGAVLARESTNVPAGRVRTGIRAFGDVYWLAALKLLAHPLFMWAFGLGLRAVGVPLSTDALTVLVLTAALPAAANVSVLAERFGADNGRVVRVILVSTVLSYVTFTAAVALLL